MTTLDHPLTLSPTRAKVSDSDIVPEEYQNRLMYWQEVFRSGQFEIGDLAIELTMLATKNGLQVTDTQIYRAVGRFCGKSGRTVRHYAEHAAFFPVEIRDEYCVLPFQHFVFAKTLGPRWLEVLEYSALHPEATEEALFVRFKAEPISLEGPETPIPTPTPTDDKTCDYSHQRLPVFSPTPVETSGPRSMNQKFYLVSKVHDLVEELTKLFDEAGLKPDENKIVREALKHIVGILSRYLDRADS